METVSNLLESLQADGKTEAEEDLPSSIPHGSHTQPTPALGHGAVVGRLLALTETGAVPLVGLPDRQGSSALSARTTIDLLPCHIGREVLLVFEHNDPTQPIVTGVLCDLETRPPAELPGQVRVEADGQRMIINAKSELVLRCGKSCFTLRSDGRIELRGQSLLTQAEETNRIRGGSVQLN